MTDITIHNELAKAIPVVIGGILAVSGGVIGHIITHYLTKSREKEKMNRDNLETFVKAIYAHSHWLDEKRNTMLFKLEDHDTLSPLDEARMIQSLHFPELFKEINEINEAQIPLIEFFFEQRIARLKDQNHWVDDWNPEPYKQAYAIYMLAIQKTTRKCRELIHKKNNNHHNRLRIYWSKLFKNK